MTNCSDGNESSNLVSLTTIQSKFPFRIISLNSSTLFVKLFMFKWAKIGHLWFSFLIFKMFWKISWELLSLLIMGSFIDSSSSFWDKEGVLVGGLWHFCHIERSDLMFCMKFEASLLVPFLFKCSLLPFRSLTSKILLLFINLYPLESLSFINKSFTK